MWTCFFDDYLTFSKDVHASNTAQSVDMLFRLLGWRYAVDGDKAQEFGTSFTALGIQIDLGKFPDGVVEFSNTDKRVRELTETIEKLSSKGSMSVLESQKLRGRMQFADSPLFGRAGKFCMKAVSDHAFVHGAGRIKDECRLAMQRFANFLDRSVPRTLQRATGHTWYIFTDACYEPTSTTWKCGLGGLLVDSFGESIQYFSQSLSDEQLRILGVPKKKTVIFEAELLAVLVAMKVWSHVIAAQQAVIFIDNNSARDTAISGVARNDCAMVLLEVLLQTEMDISTFAWYARVPSPANPSDGPSRGDLSGVPKLCMQMDVSATVASIFSGLESSHKIS